MIKVADGQLCMIGDERTLYAEWMIITHKLYQLMIKGDLENVPVANHLLVEGLFAIATAEVIDVEDDKNPHDEDGDESEDDSPLY